MDSAVQVAYSSKQELTAKIAYLLLEFSKVSHSDMSAKIEKASEMASDFVDNLITDLLPSSNIAEA